MNVKRFTARSSREALALVRQALGNDAVVLSTKPSGDGFEVPLRYVIKRWARGISRSIKRCSGCT